MRLGLVVCPAVFAALPAPAQTGSEIELRVARCVFAAHEVVPSPWGWGGVRWQLDGPVLPDGIGTGSGFKEDNVSVVVSDDTTTPTLVHDKRRAGRNAVIAFTADSDFTLASGSRQGHCKVLK